MRFDPNTVFPIVIPLIIVAVMLRRRGRARPLKLSRLWIMPVALTAFIGMGLYFTPHRAFTPLTWAIYAAVFVAGGIAGWMRGRTVPMARDPATGEVVAESTLFAILFIVGLFAVRAVVRLVLESGEAGRFDPGTVSDGFLVFAIALICVSRLEMWLRGRRLAAA